MITVLSEEPKQIEHFRLDPWQFQATFTTPLKSLNRFVEIILGTFPMERGVVSTDLVVFEPTEIIKLLADASIDIENPWKFILGADGHKSVSRMLEAMLGDWVDFLFVASPQGLALYADHDEYSTFYTRDQDSLLLVITRLERAGFRSVSKYRRGGAKDRWR